MTAVWSGLKKAIQLPEEEGEEGAQADILLYSSDRAPAEELVDSINCKKTCDFMEMLVRMFAGGKCLI